MLKIIEDVNFSLSSNGIGLRAGLRPGDLVISFNGGTVAWAADLRNRIALGTPGATVTLGYLRDRRQQSTAVVLGEK